MLREVPGWGVPPVPARYPPWGRGRTEASIPPQGSLFFFHETSPTPPSILKIIVRFPAQVLRRYSVVERVFPMGFAGKLISYELSMGLSLVPTVPQCHVLVVSLDHAYQFPG